MSDALHVSRLIAGKVEGVSRRRVDGPIGTLAETQHGVVSRRQLRGIGFEESGIDSRLRRGALHPIHRGVYAVGHRKLSTEGRWMAAVLALGSGVVLSHRSAGQLWGLLRGFSTPEVATPRKFRPRVGILAHWLPTADDETEEVDGIPVTSVSRTLFDLSAVLKREQLERAVNEAEVRQLTSRLSIPELLRRYPRRAGTACLRRLLADEEALAGVTRFELEERFAVLVDAYRLPRPRRNADIAIAGRFFEVDCIWRAQRLILELDGRAVHGTGQAFEKDRVRDRILVVEGWRVMHVTWRQLRDEPQAVMQDVRRLLEGSTVI
jgi:very-short-patch-repair endonuclease/predicted transcriptional regulator of viral defense system